LVRGTRLVFESGRSVAHVVRDLGIDFETLRKSKVTRSPDLVQRDFTASQPDENQTLNDHGVLASIGTVGDPPPSDSARLSTTQKVRLGDPDRRRSQPAT
jgi:hypothetical protein